MASRLSGLDGLINSLVEQENQRGLLGVTPSPIVEENPVPPVDTSRLDEIAGVVSSLQDPAPKPVIKPEAIEPEPLAKPIPAKPKEPLVPRADFTEAVNKLLQDPNVTSDKIMSLAEASGYDVTPEQAQHLVEIAKTAETSGYAHQAKVNEAYFKEVARQEEEQNTSTDAGHVAVDTTQGQAFDNMVEKFVNERPDASPEEVRDYAEDLSSARFGGKYHISLDSVRKSLRVREDLRRKGIRQQPIQVVSGVTLEDAGIRGNVSPKALDKANKPSFIQSVNKGVNTTRDMLWRGVQAIAEQGQMDEIAKHAGSKAEMYEAVNDALPAGTSLKQVNNIADAIQWSKQVVGEQASTLAVTGAGGVIGATVRGSVGAAAGAFAPDFIMSVGEIEGQNKAIDPNAKPGLATFVGGTAIAALDSITPAHLGTALVRRVGQEEAEEIATKMLFMPMTERVAAALSKGAQTVGAGVAREAPTEGVQQWIGEVATAIDTKTPIQPGMLYRGFEAAAAGGLVGGLAGGGEAVSEVRQPAGAMNAAVNEMRDAPFNQTAQQVATAVTSPSQRAGDLSPQDRRSAIPDDLIQEGRDLTGLGKPQGRPEEGADEEKPKAEKPEAKKPVKFLIPKGKVTSRFGKRHSFMTDNGAKATTNHAGVDIAMKEGTPIPAGADGEVIFAGKRGGYGNMVIIRHADGSTSRYAHQSRLNVEVGQEVGRGDVIGYVGHTGNATGPHLHLERRDPHGVPVNPLNGDYVASSVTDNGQAEDDTPYEVNQEPLDIPELATADEEDAPLPEAQPEEDLAPEPVPAIEEDAATGPPTEASPAVEELITPSAAGDYEPAPEEEALHDEEGTHIGWYHPETGIARDFSGQVLNEEDGQAAPETAPQAVSDIAAAEPATVPQIASEAPVEAGAVARITPSGKQVVVKNLTREQRQQIRELTGSGGIGKVGEGVVTYPIRHAEAIASVISGETGASDSTQDIPAPDAAPAPGVPDNARLQEISATVDKIDDKLFDLETDGTKGAVKLYIKKLVKQGIIHPDEAAGYDYLFKDRDMGVEDITSELRSSLNLWADEQRVAAGGQPVLQQRAAPLTDVATDVSLGTRPGVTEAIPGGGQNYGRQSEDGLGSDQAAASPVREREGFRGSPRLLDEQAGQAPVSEEPLRDQPAASVNVGGVSFAITPYLPARRAAVEYAREAGIQYDPARDYVAVDKERAKRIAQAYDEMRHDPHNPEVRAAYEAMARETMAQWQVVKRTGLKVEFIDMAQGDPYSATPRLAQADVIQNNHLWVFSTDDGYGQAGITAEDEAENPMLALTDEMISGRPARINDIFRIVHDYFGHIKDGHGFRATGEENAWQSHAAMYSPLARRAMTTETRGQNSWVNFGPYAESNKTASSADTVYAEQKVGLMPEWVSEEGMLAEPAIPLTKEGTWTTDRIDRIINTSPSGKAYAVMMSPDEFLGLTAGRQLREALAEQVRTSEAYGGGKIDLEKMRKAEPLWLAVEVGGEPSDYQKSRGMTQLDSFVFGHEGRHRMQMLKDAGVERVPVVIFSIGNNDFRSLESADLMPQRDRGSRADTPATIHNLIPISRENRQKLREMGGAAVKFQRGALDVDSEESINAAADVIRQTPISENQQRRAVRFQRVQDATAEVMDEIEKMKLGNRPNLQVRVVHNIDNGVSGSYDPNTLTVKIAAFGSLDPRATTRHEVIHWAKDQGIFNSAEWTTLQKWAREQTKLMAWAKKMYPEMDAAGQIEEAIAEGFSRMMGGDTSLMGKGFVRTAFEKFRDVIRTILSFFTNRDVTEADLVDAEEIFRRMSSGEQMEIADARGAEAREGGDTKEARTASPTAKLGDPSVPDPSIVRRLNNLAMDLVAKLDTGNIREKGDHTDNVVDLWKRKLLQQYRPIQKVQAQIAEHQGATQLPETQDVMSQITADDRGYKVGLLTDTLVKPMSEMMAERKISPGELGMYLYARHAPARNARVAKKNPTEFNTTDRPGSGMTDAEAQQIMADFAAAGKLNDLQAVANYIDDIIQFAQQQRVDAKLLTAQEIQEGFQPGDYYVPLRGNDLEPEHEFNFGVERGRGFSTSGREGRQMFGRHSQAKGQEIVGYVLSQATEAVDRAFRAKVGQTALRMFRNAPAEPDFFKIDKVERRPIFNKKTKKVEYQMQTRLTAEEKKRTLLVKEDGKVYKITFSEHNPSAMRMAKAFNNLDPVRIPGWLRLFGMYSRLFSMLNTTLNPEFVVTNPVKDVQTGLVNATNFKMKGFRRGMLKALLSFKPLVGAGLGQFKGKGSADPTSHEWHKWMEEMDANGGKLNYNQTMPMEDALRKLQGEIKNSQRGLLNPLRLVRAVLETVENMTATTENMTRLSAYVELRKRGVAPKKAAELTRELTTNFAQRGEWGPVITQLYAFAGPSLVGGAKMGYTLAKNPRVLGSLVAFGMLMASLRDLLDDDEDNGKQYTEEELDGNIILPTSHWLGHDITIPVGWGINVPITIGRKFYEVGVGKKLEDGTKLSALGAVADVGHSAVNAFSPVTGQSFWNVILPTALDPIADIYQNTDFFGHPIMPSQPFDQKYQKPDSQLYWEKTPQIWKTLAATLNKIGGGDDVVPGWAPLDISPESLKHVFEQTVGGAGRTVTRIATIATNDKDDPITEMPLARRFLKDPGGGGDDASREKSTYYTRMREAETVIQRAKELKARGSDDFTEYREDHEKIIDFRHRVEAYGKKQRTFNVADNDVEKGARNVNGLNRRQQREIYKATGILLPVGKKLSDDQVEKIKTALDERETKLATKFNERYLKEVIGE